MKLEHLVTELESYIPMADKTKPGVSRQSVGWQVHHSLKVIHSILKAHEGSDPGKYKWKFNPYRAVFLTVGWFPRGKAKAPKIARPPEEVDLEGIQTELEDVKRSMDNLNRRPPNSYFRHPYFGRLNVKQTRKFLVLHTYHHLKIIKDIVK